MYDIWDNGHIAPFDMARAFPFFMNKLIRNSLDRRMNLDDPILVLKVAAYIEQIMLRKKSSEQGITVILAFRAFGRVPLATQMEKIKMPVAFMVGDYDWVERKTGDDLLAKGHMQGEVFSVQNSGHHLYIEGALECCVNIVGFCFGEEQANRLVSTA
jgi:cardiolipin-specific phospholipase